MRMRLLKMVGLVAAALAPASCGPTLWEQSFRSSLHGSAAPTASPDSGTGLLAGAEVPKEQQPTSVLVREIPWERMERVRGELRQQAASSATHPDDWPAEQQLAARAKLLEGLQVPTDPAKTDILGFSEFRTTDTVRPPGQDGSLAAFARRIGADRVVWSARVLGKAERVSQEPVTVYRDAHDWTWDPAERRYRPGAVPDRTTGWVPVVVSTDETAWVAYFLRTRR
jgi:hypothetical protein